MEKYRSSTQLLITTLEAVDYAGREGIGITSVITKSNVCHSRLKKLMSKIISTGLVIEIRSDSKREGNFYVITEKGQMFLEEYKKFYNFAKDFGLEL
jgi:predicted transcriptional regulator